MVGSERRAAPRVRLSARMLVTVGDTTVEGVAHDLSVSGLCVDAPLKTSVGVPVVIAFHLAGLDMQLEGEVRWVRDDFVPRLGVELGELSPREAHHLSEFVALHNLPRTGDTLENLPAVPSDPSGPNQAPPVRPNLEPVVTLPSDKRQPRPGGRTRHYSLHLDDPDG